MMDPLAHEFVQCNTAKIGQFKRWSPCLRFSGLTYPEITCRIKVYETLKGAPISLRSIFGSIFLIF